MKILCVFALLYTVAVSSENIYSRESNVHFKSQLDVEPNIQLRHLDNPFRMGKLNLLWKKAQVVRLTIN